MEDQSPKPIRCKAAVCRGAGEPLTIEEIVVDPPKAYEVRVKVICTSLCHTDITFWRGNVSPAFPRILGHEAYGVVESVGEHVEGLAAGDAVVPTIVGQCGHCTTCLSEDSNRCEGVPTILGPGMRRDGTGRFWDPQGNPVHDLLAVSTFSQYTVIDVSQLSKLDPAVPPKLGCLISCGGATGVGAAWKVARLKPGSSVAIFGLGAVGLSVAQGAKMCGASKIIGVDLNPDKEKFGKAFGVTDFVNPSKLDKNNSISGVIKEMSGGGVDCSFECIGVPSVMAEAFRSTKKGNSKTIVLGVGKDNAEVRLPAQDLLYGKSIMGSSLGGLKPKIHIPILAKKCMNKELELDGLATHEVGLREINTAFDLLLQGKGLRCIIWMDK